MDCPKRESPPKIIDSENLHGKNMIFPLIPLKKTLSSHQPSTTQRWLISSSGGSRIITCEPPQLARCEEHLGCRWLSMCQNEIVAPKKAIKYSYFLGYIMLYPHFRLCIIWWGIFYLGPNFANFRGTQFFKSEKTCVIVWYYGWTQD